MALRTIFRWLGAAAVVAAGQLAMTSAAAQDSKAAYTPPSVEDVWQYPRLSNVIMSRSGKYLAATALINGRMNLTVIDLETRKGTGLTNFADVDAVDLHWVGDERIVFSLGKYDQPRMAGEYSGGGLFVVNRDGSGYRRLAPSLQQAQAANQRFRALSFVRTIPGSTDDIIAAGNQTTSDAVDLYRVNLNNGRMTLLTMGRPAFQASDWLLDSKLVPRVVTGGIKDSLTQVVYYRKDDKSPWAELARFDAHKGPTFVPLTIEPDNATLQVASNQGRDTMAVFRYNPETRSFGELLAQHPRFDIGANAAGQNLPGVLTDPETNKVLGYAVDAEKPEVVWLDDNRARTQALLDGALPGHRNNFRPTPDGKRAFVTSYSDLSPPRWYLLDEAKKTLEEVASSRPQLDGKLVEQKPFVFTSRDGLELTGYYFLPKNHAKGTPLPTVLHVHGGPMVRADRWGSGFGYLEAQLFASRGYAVIVPNFRITPGMGGKNFYAGFGSYGREMLEDHEDAVKWAVKEGLTDPARVCISGASYGGYAALMGVAKNPDFYRCAVSGLAPTDMKYQLTSLDGDTALSFAGQTYWRRILGTDDLDAPQVKAISPVFQADRIKVPVLLYAGRDDVRVPFDQINRMANALRAAGNPPKAFIAKANEGHGFGKFENNVELYKEVLNFLDKQLAVSR